jgi:hypothetical protein
MTFFPTDIAWFWSLLKRRYELRVMSNGYWVVLSK